MEITAEIVGPQAFPQPEHVGPFKLALVPDKKHAEEEKEVGRVGGLEVEVEGGIHELNEMVEGKKLCAHA